MPKTIRLGVVGGHRGKSFGQSLASLKGKMKLTAICDLDEEVCRAWQTEFPHIVTFTDYDEMLDSGAVDAVLLASPMPLHVPQAIAALGRGIHVASEVTACITIAEGKKLIKAVEESDATYFFAENYVYSRVHMMVENMARKGVFGEITYVAGQYYHDCRCLMWNEAGELTWRGELRRDFNCHTYPTHSLGPIARWLGIREGRDRFVSVTAMSSKQRAISDYAAAKLGKKHAYANPDHFAHGDVQKVLIMTEGGVLVDLLFDPVSPRVGNCAEHFVTGTKACFHSNTPIPYADGMRGGPAVSFADKGTGVMTHYAWEPLLDLAAEYEHPTWKRSMKAASSAGHGGGDFFILRDFAKAIHGGAEPAVDVYDAVLWSSFIELTDKAIRTGKTQAVPKFRPKA